MSAPENKFGNKTLCWIKTCFCWQIQEKPNWYKFQHAQSNHLRNGGLVEINDKHKHHQLIEVET